MELIIELLGAWFDQSKESRIHFDVLSGALH